MPDTSFTPLLHLGTIPSETSVLHDLLKAGGLACFMTGVETLETFDHAMADRVFAVILVDDSLANPLAFAVLQRLRDHPTPPPVIVLSSTPGEDHAVECLQRGAVDYLVRPRLERLPAAVKRAIQEGARQRQQRESSAALSASEEHFRAVLENAHDAIISASSDGCIISWNKGAQAIFGYAAEEVMGKSLTLLMPERYRQAHLAGMRRYLATGAGPVLGRTVELHGLRRDETEFPLELSLGTWSTPEGTFFTSILRDISARKEAEAALQESEERFRQFADQSSEVFWFVALDPERILYVSPAVEKIWGLPQERFYQDPRAWLKAVHLDDQPHVLDQMKQFRQPGIKRVEAEYRVMRPDGSQCWVQAICTLIRDDTGKILRIGTMAKDVTERKNVERQTLRTQRLESIGTLAGGVAHDLNNTLAPILFATEYLRQTCPHEQEILNTVETSARRGAEMVRQLLTFARGVEGARLLMQPQHVLNEVATIIKGTFPKNIQLRTRSAADLYPILGDATQLHQVLLNLCVNARDAMPAGGYLTLEAENVEIDASYAASIPDAQPGLHVVWRVTDTGTGIAPEIIERIFEPFFTTKGPDKGTGLGLSTIIGIVKSHGGFVQVSSIPGGGSTFSIYLAAEQNSVLPTEILPKPDLTFRGGGETILVVDDEPSVLDVARHVLASLNFTIRTASDGAEALRKAAGMDTELRAVITDQHMPHMDGLTFVRALKNMMPKTGVIVASGRLDEREAAEFRALGVHAILDKPYTQNALMTVLKGLFQN